MRNTPAVILALIALALGGALFAQQKRHATTTAAMHAQLAELNERVTKGQRELAELRAKNDVYRNESETLRKRVADGGAAHSSETVAPGTASAAAPGKGEEGPASFMKGFAKMFSDPEMKKAMRGQQGMVVRMMYGDLAKELGLSGEEANQVMELLVERQMGMAAQSMELMSNAAGDQAKVEEGGKAINAARADYDAQIKGLLGDEKMKKLEQYERTVGDRMQMQQYQQSLTASGVPLEDKQRDDLIGIMHEERLKMPPSPFEAGNKDASAQFKAMQSSEHVANLMKMTNDFNAKVRQRAQAILTPA